MVVLFAAERRSAVELVKHLMLPLIWIPWNLRGCFIGHLLDTVEPSRYRGPAGCGFWWDQHGYIPEKGPKRSTFYLKSQMRGKFTVNCDFR